MKCNRAYNDESNRYVVGENEEFSICNMESLDNLYYYNFAGRNIKFSTQIEEIYNLFLRLDNNEFDINQLLKVSELVRKKYDSKYLSDKLLPLIKNNIENRKYKFIKTRMFIEFIKLYRLIVSDYLKRKM